MRDRIESAREDIDGTMTDTGPTASQRSDRWLEARSTNVQLVCIFYLVSIVVGLTAIVGIVIAYINRGKWCCDHGR